MASAPSGHIEQLPSGSWRAKVYAGVDPLTRREIRLRETCKTERAAQIALGKLLERAAVGRQPESNVTVARLMDEYAAVAEWELSTREANEGYIRRTVKPALGHLHIRRVRGPLLDKLYAQLKRCGDPSCTGRPFTEHRRIPVLIADPADSRPGWEQAAGRLREAIVSGDLAQGEPLPSVRELNDVQGVRTATIQHAFAVLADERLIVLRHGRTAVVAGESESNGSNGRARRPGRSHDCKLAGCRPHVCKPMKAKTIRNIQWLGNHDQEPDSAARIPGGGPTQTGLPTDATAIQTGDELPPGSSREQRDAERVMLDLLGQQLGRELNPARLSVPSGERVEVDGTDANRSLLVECWAHQGPPKSAQRHKVLADAFELTWIATTMYPRPRLILCLSDPLAAAPFLPGGRSWAARAFQDLGVTISVVDLPAGLRHGLLQAQRRQYR